MLATRTDGFVAHRRCPIFTSNFVICSVISLGPRHLRIHGGRGRKERKGRAAKSRRRNRSRGCTQRSSSTQQEASLVRQEEGVRKPTKHPYHGSQMIRRTSSKNGKKQNKTNDTTELTATDGHGHGRTRDNPPSTHRVRRGNKASVCGDWSTARDNPPSTHPVTQGNKVRVCGNWTTTRLVDLLRDHRHLRQRFPGRR